MQSPSAAGAGPELLGDEGRADEVDTKFQASVDTPVGHDCGEAAGGGGGWGRREEGLFFPA